MVERFLPSIGLTGRITYGIVGDDLDFPAVELIGIRKVIGERVLGLAATLSFIAGAEDKTRVILGRNGNFSSEVFSMLSQDRLPISNGQVHQLYSELYNEFHQYVLTYNNQVTDWGILTADNEGVYVMNPPKTVKRKAEGPKAKVIGGVALQRE